MILYLETSALVKRYITEKNSEQLSVWIEAADIIATSLITRVEVSAAIGRARRMKIIPGTEAQAALNLFRSEWESFLRLPITENTVARGDWLAYEHNLRGYDATHLACALIWQETLNMSVTLATFDQQLHAATQNINLKVIPFQV